MSGLVVYVNMSLYGFLKLPGKAGRQLGTSPVLFTKEELYC